MSNLAIKRHYHFQRYPCSTDSIMLKINTHTRNMIYVTDLYSAYFKTKYNILIDLLFSSSEGHVLGLKNWSYILNITYTIL